MQDAAVPFESSLVAVPAVLGLLSKLTPADQPCSLVVPCEWLPAKAQQQAAAALPSPL